MSQTQKKANPTSTAAVKADNKASIAAPAETKLTGIEKAKKRREDLAKIIAYAAYKIGLEPEVLDEKEEAEIAELKSLCGLYMPKVKKAKPGNEPTWSAALRKVMGGDVTKNEDRIWNETKSTAPLGRTDMQNLIRDAVLREKPAFRFWVQFDQTSKSYNVLGVGEKAPAGWTGKLPKDQAKTDVQRLNDTTSS
jgi:hypothetical protein